MTERVTSMNNIIVFNSFLFTNLTLLSIAYLSIIAFTGNFFERDTRYVPLTRILKQAMFTFLLLIIGIWLLSQFYNALSHSHISLEKLGNDSLITVIVLASSILVSICIISMILNLIKTIKMFLVYIDLKKDNIPNNLRHALYKQNFESIINNYKLLKMSDEKVSLSDKEVLQLSAVLSNTGMYEDVQEILKIKLFKQNTFRDYMFSVFSYQQNYSVQCNAENISYNSQLKTALQKHAMCFRYVYMSMFIVAIFQIYIPTLHLITNTSPTIRGGIALLVTSIIINSAIVLKYIILKNIYQKSLNISDVKIKSNNIDKVIFICQSILIVTTIIRLLMS